MKKLLYFSVLGLAAATALTACDNEPKNPGDFSVKSKLEVVGVRSLVTGTEYPLVVARSIDSTYRYTQTVYDTLRDVSGEFVLGDDGKLVITEHDEYTFSKITAKFVEFEPITIPSYEDIEMDTIEVALQTNANWISDGGNISIEGQPVTWYSVLNSTSTGGGDGSMLIGVKKFAGTTSKHIKERTLLTRDSTVMYSFRFIHTGTKYTDQ